MFFIALGMFGLYAVEFGVVGILPAIMERYQISIVQAGWLVGFFALVIAICGPFMVLWLSKFNRKKLLVSALIVFSVCSALSAYAPTFASLMALRVPAALLHAVFFSVAFTTAKSLYPPERAAHATALAFTGTSVGLVLGVPATAWVAASFSYEAAFHFSAVANLIAAIGIWAMLPSGEQAKKNAQSPPLGVLRNAGLWLAILQTICVFAAMFSLYSYAVEYLVQTTGMDGQKISFLLVVFGVGGVLGNLFAGRTLGRALLATVFAYPLILSASYLIVMVFASASFTSMLAVCFVWGAAHTAGMVISQVWTVSSAPEAPEFVTSLFVSAGNLGVLAGSMTGAWFITWAGMNGAIWSGWLFSALATLLVVISVRLKRLQRIPQCVPAS
ncbi:arabinose ABC transporter permease [Pseudomonas fulva]|uniref:Arabinose ABC transporter permease n=2 Tax=Pseudomonas TaxID=286 RepID=A0A0D0KLF9_9PSED|nr:arabinose ABC transporter permease [Pseudomonas fulva]